MTAGMRCDICVWMIVSRMWCGRGKFWGRARWCTVIDTVRCSGVAPPSWLGSYCACRNNHGAYDPSSSSSSTTSSVTPNLPSNMQTPPLDHPPRPRYHPVDRLL